jgi:hypothetical protein
MVSTWAAERVDLCGRKGCCFDALLVKTFAEKARRSAFVPFFFWFSFRLRAMWWFVIAGVSLLQVGSFVVDVLYQFSESIPRTGDRRAGCSNPHVA